MCGPAAAGRWCGCRAQAQAFRAAERAQTQYEQAIKHEDYVHAHAGSEGSYIRDSVADERRLAQFHGVRSTEALRLAEMWARVAQALADGELPVTTTFEILEHPDTDEAGHARR